MKRFGIAALLIWGTFVTAMSANTFTDIITWGYGGVDRAREWVGPSGRLGIQSTMQDQASGIDIWPTGRGAATDYESAELTLHRQLWSDPCQERLSLSAMVGSGGEYRFSNEISAECGHAARGLKFCFDNPIPGSPANCRLWVKPDGIYTSDDGTTWRKL